MRPYGQKRVGYGGDEKWHRAGEQRRAIRTEIAAGALDGDSLRPLLDAQNERLFQAARDRDLMLMALREIAQLAFDGWDSKIEAIARATIHAVGGEQP